MENLKLLTDNQLMTSTRKLADFERATTLRMLHRLLEIEERMLHARAGFSSLFTYMVEELKYTPATASSHLGAMRVLRSCPEIESRIESGALPLSNLSQVQAHFRNENIYKAEEKREVLARIEGKSVREVQAMLASESCAPEKLVHEKVRPIAKDLHTVTFAITDQELDQIEELKALLSHKMPGQKLRDLVMILVKEGLQKHRPQPPKPLKTVAPLPTSEPEKRSRYIPAETDRAVRARDEHRCTHVDSVSGRRCRSQHFLEFDHVLPFALGGTNDINNLRLRCRTHNRVAAIEAFGAKKMAAYGPRH